MRKARHIVGQLAAIAQLRDIQSQLAEMRAAIARRALSDAERSRSVSVDAEGDAERAWSQSVRSGGLANGVVTMWAGELLVRHAYVEQAEQAVAAATTEADGRARAWRRSLAEAEIAGAALGKARRRYRRDRDEARLAEASERYSARRVLG